MEKSPLQDTAAVEVKSLEEDPPPRRVWRTVAIACIAVAVGFSHSYYAATLFENDRNFSFLSDLEREMSLRTEMGFYYSYYKLVAQDHSFSVGISKIMYDRLVEFPTEVNAFNRFNIYPEVIVGALYRYFEPWLNTTSFVQCSRVTREGMSDVISCDGFGVPMVFYLHAVWLLAGVAVGAIFTAATTISDSMLGGLLAVGQFYANHGEATRVQWAPNERENFAWPLLVLQSWLVCMQLRDKKKEHTFMIQLGIFILNFLTLIFWQFTQFIYFTQLFIFFMMEQLRIINNKTFWVFLHAHFCGIHTAILILHGNDMLKLSIYPSFFIVIALYSMLFSHMRLKVETRMDFLVEAWLVFLRVFIALFGSFYLKKVFQEFTGGQDDSHIWDLLLSKFDSAYTNFHTLLYTCSEIFDFLPFETVYNLTVTCLIPLVILNVGVVFNYYAEKSYQKEVKVTVEPKCDEKKNTGIDDTSDATLRQKNNAQPTDTIEQKSDAILRQRNNEQPSDTIKQKSDETLRQGNNVQPTDTIEQKNNVKQEETKDLWLDWLRRADIEPELVYSIAQLCVYGMMAFLVMRLKLLFVTQLCIMSGLIFKTKYHAYMGDSWVKGIHKLLIGLAFLTLCWVVVNVSMELSHMGDFNDPHMEEMLTWINDHTPRTAAFAGSMPCMVTIMLSTRRPIVTHPHYENAEARERAYSVYKTYGRFSPQELYEEMTKLQVSFLVVESKYCYGSSSRNCTYGSIWDLERPELSYRPPLCHLLQQAPVDHFFRLFGNARYSIYMVHDYIVEYMPRSFDT